MKKRVLSALLVLCMACSMVSTVWATETNATSGAPEPASQTLNLDNEQPGDESGADSTGAPSDSTDSTSASSDSTSSGSSSAASDATSGAVSDATSGEGDESAASSDSTAASDSTSSSSSASSDSSDSNADDPNAASSDVTGDESGTGAEEESDPVAEQPSASPEPVPSQPNRAPAAAPGTTANSDNDIELYAEPGAGKYTFQVTWKPDSYSSGTNDEYVQVILYDTESKDTISISGNDFDAWLNSHTQMANGDTWNISQDHPQINGYDFDGAEYWRKDDGEWDAQSISKVRAVREGGFTKRWYYYINDGGQTRINNNQLVIRLNYTPTQELDDPTPQGDFYIDDKIIQAGTLVPQFSDPNFDNAQKVVSYKWYRSDSENGSYTEVTRRKVTLDSYNVTETGDALYPSFDGGARQWYYVEAYDAEGNLLTTSPKFQVPLYDALQNGSFETPKLKDYGQRDPNPQSGEEGIVWKTTADDNEIELIRVDKDISGDGWGEDDRPQNSDTWDVYGLYDTADGDQVAELNANSAGALYQDVLTVPGSTLTWELSHRARNRGNSKNYTGDDTMYVIIMSTDRAEDYTTQSQIEGLVAQHQSELNQNNYYYDSSTGIAIWKLTDGASWVEHSSTYVVPTGQHATRFFFAAGHTAFDDEYPNETKLKNTVGNFIDDVSFDDEIPAPNDDEINLTLSKTVVGLTDEELADYTVDITVQGIEGTEYSNTVQFNAENFIFNDDESSATATRPIQIKLPANAGTQTYKISESVSGLVDGKEATSSTVAVNDGASEEGTSTTISASGGHSYTIAFTNTYTPTIPKTATLTLEKTFVGLTDEDVYFLLFDQTKSDNLKDRREANFSFDVNFCDTKEDSFKEGSGWMENLQKQDNNDSPYKNETYYHPGTEEVITNGGEFIVYSVDCLEDVGLDAFKAEGYCQDTRVNGIGAYLRKENDNWVYTQTLTVPTCTDSGNRYFYTVFEQHAELPGYSKLDTSSVSYTVSLNNGEKMWNGIGKFICDEDKSIVSMDGITEQECIYGKTEEGDEITPFARLYITGDTTIEFENNYLDSMEVTKNVTLDGTAITSAANEELNKEYTITLSPADTTKLVSTSSNSNKKGQGPDWNTKMTGYTVTATYSGGLQQHNETTLTFNNDGTLDIPLYPDETVTLGNLPSISYQLTESETVTADTDSYYFDGKSFVEIYNDDKVSSDAAQWNSYNTSEDVGKSNTQDGKVALDVSLTDHDESVAVTLTNQYKTYKQLTIKKVTTGAMGADDDWFDFEVTGDNNAEYTLTDNQEPTNSDYDFKLNNGSTVVLTKLKDGDVVTIRENGAVNGYTFQGADAEATSEGGFELTPKNGDGDSGDYTVNSANNAVTVTIPDNAEADLGIMTFTNARQAVAPTGLESNHTTPYVLMITAAGMAGLALIGGIVARRIRRRRQE